MLSIFSHIAHYRLHKATDDQLFQRYCEGNSHAFSVLYERYRANLFHYLCRRCQNTAFAEEIYQETWERLIQRRQMYQPQGQFKALLFTTATNLLHDNYRQQQRRQAHTQYDENTEQSEQITSVVIEPEQQHLLQESLHQLTKIIDDLPDTQQQAILLKLEGFSLEEIARISSCGVETVKSRLRYAMAKIKQLAGEISHDR